MDPDKLAKVLAMVESDHAGEAISALRAARIILARAGMSFRDLAQGARPRVPDVSPPKPAPPAAPPPPDQMVSGLRRQVADLERELGAVRRQLDKANTETDRLKEEANRWRQLARETAEKLWDIGKALEGRSARLAFTDRRRAVIDHLQDPRSAVLSDQEIARKVGTSAQSVAHWRRRLAFVGRKLRLAPVALRGRGLWLPPARLPAPNTGLRGHWLGLPAWGRGPTGNNTLRAPAGSHRPR
jgi:plasmid stabilization system protein ParE